MQIGKLGTNLWSFWPRVQLCSKYYHKFCTNRERFKQNLMKTHHRLAPCSGPLSPLPREFHEIKFVFSVSFHRIHLISQWFSVSLSLFPFLDFGFLDWNSWNGNSRIWLDGYDIFGVEWDDLWPPLGIQQLTCFILLWYVHLRCVKREFAFVFQTQQVTLGRPPPPIPLPLPPSHPPKWHDGLALTTYLSLVRWKNEWNERTKKKREKKTTKEHASMASINFYKLPDS